MYGSSTTVIESYRTARLLYTHSISLIYICLGYYSSYMHDERILSAKNPSAK